MLVLQNVKLDVRVSQLVLHQVIFKLLLFASLLNLAMHILATNAHRAARLFKEFVAFPLLVGRRVDYLDSVLFLRFLNLIGLLLLFTGTFYGIFLRLEGDQNFMDFKSEFRIPCSVFDQIVFQSLIFSSHFFQPVSKLAVISKFAATILINTTKLALVREGIHNQNQLRVFLENFMSLLIFSEHIIIFFIKRTTFPFFLVSLGSGSCQLLTFEVIGTVLLC